MTDASTPMPVRLPATPIAHGATRYVGATVIDGTGRAPLRDAEVEVRDGEIAYVGPRRRSATGDARVENLDGAWLLPGFVDVHVHASMVPASPETQRGWFVEQSVLEVADILRRTVAAGVTTARDLDGLTPGYRHAIAEGKAIGPRLHVAIAMLSPTGGHADPHLPNGALQAWALRLGSPPAGTVDTDADIVRFVRELFRQGADVIKVCTSGGVGSPTDEPTDVGFTQEQVRLVADIAAARGRPAVTAHALTDSAVRAAVLGGVRSVEHGYDMSDETIALMAERGTVLVPTLSTLMRELDPQRVTPDRLRHRALLQERGMDSVRRAIAAGVRVAMGTDAGVHPHGRNLREVAWLVEAGLSPLAAIRAGTLEGARLMGIESRIGSIEAGKLADLVVVQEDPLADPLSLSQDGAVRAVLQSGRRVSGRGSDAENAGPMPVAGEESS